MQLLTRAMLYCALLFLPLVSALAQSTKGIVTGRVVDSKGGVLQGASVDLEPSGATAVTNNQGEFKVLDVPPGIQKLTVMFVGFSPFTTDVTVTGGQTAQVQAVLQVGTKNEEVLVTAERPHGEAEAINRERTFSAVAHSIVISRTNEIPFITPVAVALVKKVIPLLESKPGPKIVVSV